MGFFFFLWFSFVGVSEFFSPSLLVLFPLCCFFFLFPLGVLKGMAIGRDWLGGWDNWTGWEIWDLYLGLESLHRTNRMGLQKHNMNT